MIKSFKYRLYPTDTQSRLLAETLETCRVWYNHCLAERKDAYEKEKRNVGVYAQHKNIKAYRANNQYAAKTHVHALQVACSDLDKAFQAFFRRVKSGDAPGYPRFKGRNRFDSFGFKEHGNGFKIDGRRLKISGVGRVAVRWHRALDGKIKSVRIKRQAGKWYAVFACQVEPRPLEPTGADVGIDVGVHHLYATSDGDTVENPKWYRAAQRKLRVLQRSVARKTKGGSNRRSAVLKLQRQHARIANARADFIKKTVHGLIAKYDRIAFEDLNVAGMVRNRHLSKSILDAGWSYFVSHLSFKAAEAGRTVCKVEPSYTSKTCSGCGRVFENLTLSDRWITCSCGVSMDRDINAALNIRNRAGHVRWGLT